MWIIILLGSLLLLIHHYFIKPLKYWEDKKIQHEKPLPLFGNFLPFVIRTSSNVELFHKIYNNHPNARYIGIYSFTTPSLMIKDPDLIKKIMVKEFETFPEHRSFLPKDTDPLWSNNLFAMEGGEKWHQLRSTLSPSFTSSKMKAMFVLMKECSKNFLTYYKSKSDEIDVELKDAFGRFSNDVIASTAYGVICNSLANPKNEFYILGKEIVVMGGLRRVAILINLLSPTCAKILGLSLFSKKVRQFFTTLVKDTLELRRKKHIVRPDMLHLLMESQKGNLTYEENAPEAGFAVAQESEFGKVSKKSKLVVTDDIITSQVMVFFFAGFDTVSTMMSYTIYELALNPDIQKRLREEIDDAVKLSNGEITYDNLMGMQFLDMVVSESLRKWPPFVVNDRRSIRPYTIEPEYPTEVPLVIEKHFNIFCPIFSIQRDAKYYPNPDKFDPERFSEENRKNIRPYTYLPFGMGPRNCIGSRFALLEGKLIVAETVKNFEIFRIEKTQDPIIFSKTNFNPVPDEGIWVGLRRRKDSM